MKRERPMSEYSLGSRGPMLRGASRVLKDGEQRNLVLGLRVRRLPEDASLLGVRAYFVRLRLELRNEIIVRSLADLKASLRHSDVLLAFSRARPCPPHGIM
eukprot:CAMPEP_0119416860 /NCGR_PEP_ID=MMETSP1335-20130426/14366_1 /TAXON_ID=259385 /ORGANISM="Chrysoculter rhomboideus, Strain RCC1486" /LENGTH=100 /DNA_ID=CAMNT_0007442005 /DNA_START=256 /DNA_END=557 /DNA_ORIENTATION=+